MIRSISSLLCILALATFAAASNCHVQRILIPSRHVAPVIAIQDHHNYDEYRVRYNPSGDQLEAFKLFIEKYDARTNELIQAIKANPGTGGALLPIKAAHPGDLVMANRCATCHDETTAKAKGGGKVYFRAGAFIDSPENVSAVIGAAIEDGTMPKGGKLSDTEKLDLMRRLVVQTKGEK